MRKLVEKTRSRWRRFSRITRIVIIVLVLGLIAFRLALPSMVERFVNRRLNSLPDYGGKVGDIDIHLYRGAYTINGVNIFKKNGKVPVPLVSARTVDLSVQWKELFHKSLVGEILVDEGKLNFVKSENAEESQTGIDKSWTQVVEGLFPFRINHFEIDHGQIWYQDVSSKPKVDVFVTNMVAVATNLTNTRDLKTRFPADFRLKGITLGGGQLDLHVKIDPLADRPTFDLAAGVKGMDLTAINDLLEAYAKVNVKRGTFEVYSEIAAENGKFNGYVKPFFENLDIFDLKQDSKNPLKLAWQAIVAAAVQLFKNHPKNDVATKIPISGDLDQPNVDVWTTVGNVLRNAFVKAFTPRIDNTIGPGKVGDKKSKSEKKTQKKAASKAS